ncbi:putative bifunctional diguanylate cyclase/phosphodiesterase, partial [Roseibium hamelinense]
KSHNRSKTGTADRGYILSVAQLIGQTSRGLEYGDTSVPAITVARPWVHSGETLGYIKLGIDISGPLSAIGTAIDADIVKVVDTASLSAQNSAIAEEAEWLKSDRFMFRAVGSGPAPAFFSEVLQTGALSGSFAEKSFISGGRLKVVHPFPVTLADGTKATSLYLLQDLTDEFRAFAQSAGISLVAALLLAALSWISFKRLLGTVEASVLATRERLEQEVASNTEELEYSRNRLQEAQRIASIGSWERNLETGELHWSEELYRIVGVPTDTDAVNARKALYRQIPAAERPMVEKSIQHAIDAVSNFDFEHRIIRDDGSVRYLHVRGYVIANHDGLPKRMFGTVLDITERHTAQEQSQLLAGILEASLNEVYIVNATSFKIEHVNQCARENLGYHADELYELCPWDISPQHTEQTFRDMVAPVLDGTMPLLNVEGIQLRKDGTSYPVEVRFQLYRERNKDLLVAIANDLTERSAREREIRSAKEEAERMAYFDTLTQLPNRAACQRDAEHAFSKDSSLRPKFIIHLDIDNFKRINDTLGHSAGDYCLDEAGERLRTCCTGLGQAYRWGGDEFVIVASGPDVDAEELCERVNLVMRAPMEFDGNQIWPSVSMGVARCPEDGDTFETLLVHADLALYRSKDSGKDRWCFFTSDMKIDSDAEARTEQELRTAIRNNEFFLVFQPQVNIRTQKVTGIEALIRWNHPTRGVLGPGAFLPVVEKSNLAATVGDIVIDKALAAARSWMDRDLDFGRIAVNLSPSHLTSGTLLNDFNAAMKKHGVGPEHLTAEVLESVFLDDERSDNSQVLEELHRLGVHIELDDFGTGYASLSHVADLPINGLKIDRSFTAQILDDGKKEVVVNQLIHLARSLDIGVICEGVETDAQFDRLRMMGDFSVQGYLIARPMPFEDITEWLSASPEDLLFVV